MRFWVICPCFQWNHNPIYQNDLEILLFPWFWWCQITLSIFFIPCFTHCLVFTESEFTMYLMSYCPWKTKLNTDRNHYFISWTLSLLVAKSTSHDYTCSCTCLICFQANHELTSMKKDLHRTSENYKVCQYREICQYQTLKNQKTCLNNWTIIYLKTCLNNWTFI